MIEVHRTSPIEVSVTMEPVDARKLAAALDVALVIHTQRANTGTPEERPFAYEAVRWIENLTASLRNAIGGHKGP